jgi:hypothetical protein
MITAQLFHDHKFTVLEYLIFETSVLSMPAFWTIVINQLTEGRFTEHQRAWLIHFTDKAGIRPSESRAWETVALLRDTEARSYLIFAILGIKEMTLKLLENFIRNELSSLYWHVRFHLPLFDIPDDWYVTHLRSVRDPWRSIAKAFSHDTILPFERLRKRELDTQTRTRLNSIEEVFLRQ